MIHYLQGDATEPQGEGVRILTHVCNNIGKWGAGFTRALDAKHPSIGSAYKQWYEQYSPVMSREDMLGTVFWMYLHNGVTVANMIAQDGVGTDQRRIRYDALDKCLDFVGREALRAADHETRPISVHMPRIGCGLAGGRWEEIEPIIQKELVGRELEVYVYDLPGSQWVNRT